MTEEQTRKLDELHAFFMKPRAPGRPSRAQELDDVLMGVRTGKLSIRVFMWACGAVVATAAAWSQLKGFLK